MNRKMRMWIVHQGDHSVLLNIQWQGSQMHMPMWKSVGISIPVESQPTKWAMCLREFADKIEEAIQKEESLWKIKE